MTTSTDTDSTIHTLVVLAGPTGVGKTALSLELAKALNAPIVSADSRQIYREMVVGTASPTPVQLAQVPHFLVGTKSVADYYSAYAYEQEVLSLLDGLFAHKPVVVLTGGSMMYIDSVCRGMDDIPTISEAVRQRVMHDYHRHGLAHLQEMLRQLDPEFYTEVDLKNHKRVIHAVEVCLEAEKPYSALRTGALRKRPFRIVRVALERDRDELYQRINARVDEMLASGLMEEARELWPYRHLNALNTVGYKEMFEVMDGKMTLDEATELLKRNTRRYAKRQLTWFRRNPEYRWFHPSQANELIDWVKKELLNPPG